MRVGRAAAARATQPAQVQDRARLWYAEAGSRDAGQRQHVVWSSNGGPALAKARSTPCRRVAPPCAPMAPNTRSLVNACPGQTTWWMFPCWSRQYPMLLPLPRKERCPGPTQLCPSALACVSARWGTGYISAVSKKSTPASAHWLSRRSASSGDVLSPNSIVPAGILESSVQKSGWNWHAMSWPYTQGQ